MPLFPKPGGLRGGMVRECRRLLMSGRVDVGAAGIGQDDPLQPEPRRAGARTVLPGWEGGQEDRGYDDPHDRDRIAMRPSVRDFMPMHQTIPCCRPVDLGQCACEGEMPGMTGPVSWGSAPRDQA
jgi:hypothetical protein